MFYTILKNFCRFIPGFHYLYNPPLRLYNYFYFFFTVGSVVTLIGWYQRPIVIREFARKKHFKEQVISESISNFTANHQLRSLITDKVFRFDSLEEQFLIVVKSNERTEEVLNMLQGKLTNYNHRVICLVKESYSPQQQSDSNVDFCVTDNKQEDNLEDDTIFLIHTGSKKLLHSCPIESNNPSLIRTLRLRMNKILDQKFTINYQNIK